MSLSDLSDIKMETMVKNKSGFLSGGLSRWFVTEALLVWMLTSQKKILAKPYKDPSKAVDYYLIRLQISSGSLPNSD